MPISRMQLVDVLALDLSKTNRPWDTADLPNTVQDATEDVKGILCNQRHEGEEGTGPVHGQEDLRLVSGLVNWMKQVELDSQS